MIRAMLITIILLLSIAATGFSAEKWKGLDETVIEKIAEEHGRAPKEPVINTDQGDLLLFVFLGAGVIGGFAAGYFYRGVTDPRLTEPSSTDMNSIKKDTESDA